MKNYLRIAKNIGKTYLKDRRLLKEKEARQIQFYNFWPHKDDDKLSFARFIRTRHLLDSYPNGKVAVFSVFGSRNIIKMSDADVKIFYTIENLKRSDFIKYADHGLGVKSVDLALGLEQFESDRYLRFPFWLLYHTLFQPEFTKEEILERCKALRYPDISQKSKFASLVAGAAWDGLREQMVAELNNIFHVNCAGRVLHNDDSLATDFHDNKVDYLKQFQFSICPENHNLAGYVSEKCFEAHLSGCIPIYWGGYGCPEKDVLNQDAIIFWDRESNGKEAIATIRDLYEHPNLWKEFASQPRLADTAEEFILDSYLTLEKRLERIFREKMTFQKK